MRKWGWLLGAAVMALLLSQPEAAVNGAREAMAKWYYAVAPALFPFMALMPLLTSAEASACAEFALGGVTRVCFGLPGAAAPALVIGMVGGSPGGCMAARRVSGLTRAQLERLCAASCGLSPAFFISGIGAAMLGSTAYGKLLFRSQVCTQAALLLLLRLMPDDGTAATAAEGETSGAVGAILSVGGYMALFGAVAACVGEMSGPVLCALDVSSGAMLIAGLNRPIYERLLCLSVLTGFGGCCVLAQNLAALRGTGLRPARFVAYRCAAAALNAAFTALQWHKTALRETFTQSKPLQVSALFAVFLAIPAVFRLKKQVH